MLSFSDNLKVFLTVEPCDMRSRFTRIATGPRCPAHFLGAPPAIAA
jgi:hypothetical protein